MVCTGVGERGRVGKRAFHVFSREPKRGNDGLLLRGCSCYADAHHEQTTPRVCAGLKTNEHREAIRNR